MPRAIALPTGTNLLEIWNNCHNFAVPGWALPRAIALPTGSKLGKTVKIVTFGGLVRPSTRLRNVFRRRV